MLIPSPQKLVAAGMALAGLQSDGDSVSKGKLLDYAVEKCIDTKGNTRCSVPFTVQKDSCYEIKWSTDGAVFHTTVEARDAGSDEIVYNRDTDGKWSPKKNELVYLDFKPKIWGQGNDTVEYEVTKCDDNKDL